MLFISSTRNPHIASCQSQMMNHHKSIMKVYNLLAQKEYKLHEISLLVFMHTCKTSNNMPDINPRNGNGTKKKKNKEGKEQ